ncbi:hypothetical protein D3C78_1701230 [compost metagenome]
MAVVRYRFQGLGIRHHEIFEGRSAGPLAHTESALFVLWKIAPCVLPYTAHRGTRHLGDAVNVIHIEAKSQHSFQ